MKDIFLNVYYKSVNVFFDQGSNTLSVNDKIIWNASNTNVISLTICSSSIIIILDTEELKCSVAKSYREKAIGNMLSLSFDGTLLWKANDILNDNHYPFSGGYILTEADKKSYTKWHGVLFDEKHEYFDAFTLADEHYLIDITDNKFLVKKVIRG